MATEHHKVCCTCKISLPIPNFCKDQTTKDGLSRRCKSCSSIAKRDAYAKNKEDKQKKRREYYANNRDRVLKNNAASKSRNIDSVKESKKRYYESVKSTAEYQEKSAKYREENKARKSAYDAEYRRINSLRLQAIKRKWNEKNKGLILEVKRAYKARRRSSCLNGDHPSVIKRWVDSQKKVCYWCGSKCESDYHVDHYEPLAKGGSHAIDNLVISCPSCNLRKNAKDPYKFAAQVGRLF